MAEYTKGLLMFTILENNNSYNFVLFCAYDFDYDDTDFARNIELLTVNGKMWTLSGFELQQS